MGGHACPGSIATITVPVVRVDDEVGDQVIDVLKIDVEGADTWVLFGCERLLTEKRVRRVFFEQNTSRMIQLGIREGEAQQFLKRHGYTCEPMNKLKTEWVAYPNE